ncbi:MAG: FtsX-like permease family protein [Halobacteriota archaeon]|nr:FtsX-like permease family protein [Halobacteriota archaeon]
MSGIKAYTRTALFLAIKDLSKDKAITFLVVFVVAFGFLFFGISTGLSDGFYYAFQDQVITTLSSHITIEPLNKDEAFDHSSTSNIEKKVEFIPGIVGISPILKTNAYIFTEEKGLNADIVGLTPSIDSKVTDLHEKVTHGEYLDDDDTDQIVLGIQLTNVETEGGFSMTTIKTNIDIYVGEKISITYDNGVTREYTVKGILEGGVLGSDWTAYVTNKEMKAVYGEEMASKILIKVDDHPEAVDKYKATILQQGIHGEVKTWKDEMGFIETVSQSLEMFTQVITAIGLMTTIITVAIVIFINSTRKKRLFGVIKAVGARNNVILTIFIIESLFFAAFGIVIGIGLSYAAQAFVTAFPITIPLGNVYLYVDLDLFVNAAIYISLASVLAGFYPAFRAARGDIIESIWKK